MSKAPPKPQAQPQAGGADLSQSYLFTEINPHFKSDRAFHSMINDKKSFTNFLTKLGDIGFEQRGPVAKGMANVVDMNPRLLQDNGVFRSIIQIMKNIPPSCNEFHECAGKIMVKLREALIKNKNALNLYHKPMAEYSKTIQDFLSLVPAKPKNSFFGSLDQKILDFIMGKVSAEQRDKKQKEREAAQKKKQAMRGKFGDDEDEEVSSSRMQQLVKMMFSDVMHLEPELVSAAILTLVTQLPHGDMVIEDRSLQKSILNHFNI